MTLGDKWSKHHILHNIAHPSLACLTLSLSGLVWCVLDINLSSRGGLSGSGISLLYWRKVTKG